MSAIKILAEQLASRGDAALWRLLRSRPDLLIPPVANFAALAARASTRSSIQRALENVNTPQHRVLETLVIAAAQRTIDGVAIRDLAKLLPDLPAERLNHLLDELVQLALIFQVPDPDQGRDPAFVPTGQLREAIGPYPGNLGRPLQVLVDRIPAFADSIVAAVDRLRAAGIELAPAAAPAAAAESLRAAVADPQRWENILALAPPSSRETLRRLSTTPVGTASADGAVTSVEWLLSHALAVRLDSIHVELAQEIGMALRGQRAIVKLDVEPERPAATAVRLSRRDNAAYGAAAETLRQLNTVLVLSASAPVSTLRSGGVGVRETKRIADTLETTTGTASWLLELGAGCGALTLDADTSRWMPADSPWDSTERHTQWLFVVRSWLELERAPSLVGSPAPSGVAINALAAEGSRPDAPLVRRRMLEVLAELTAECPLAEPSASENVPGFTPEQVIERLCWHQPRLARRFERLVPGMFAEAAHLGLLGAGSLTEAGTLISQDEAAQAQQVLAAALPAPVSHFVVQADLTAVAPGFLDPAVARELALLAVPEGQGPASTYRFSAESIRAGLDSGLDAPAILAFLRRHSLSGLPQPLVYLIEDAALRHGRVRVGTAVAYVRSDDEQALSDLLEDPRFSSLGLALIAPTVLVSTTATRGELEAALRSLGHHPTPDQSSSAGESRMASRNSVAVTGAGTRHPRTERLAAMEEDLENQIELLRAAQTGASTRPAGSVQESESEMLLGLESLHTAIRRKLPVRLGVVDGYGTHSRELLVPRSVSAGRVRVFDPAKEVELVISVHRIVDVELVEGVSDD